MYIFIFSLINIYIFPFIHSNIAYNLLLIFQFLTGQCIKFNINFALWLLQCTLNIYKYIHTYIQTADGIYWWQNFSRLSQCTISLSFKITFILLLHYCYYNINNNNNYHYCCCCCCCFVTFFLSFLDQSIWG